MDVKKYTDVVRMGHRETVGVVKEGDYITVYEKLDGANASFKLNLGGEDSELVAAFSRNTRLSPENNLRGFYEWTRTISAGNLLDNAIYYGEWLVKHKVDYGQHANGFYLFDIYDVESESYAPTDFVIAEAARLGLMVAPILYAGPYRSFEHLQSLVGRSALATKPDGGEGIVVKNVGYRDRFGQQTFVKLVSDEFREMQPQKAAKDPNAPLSAESAFVRTFMTRARVEKLLLKLVDEGVIVENFGLEDMGVILRELGNRVIDDLLKEEGDSLPADYEEKTLRQAVGKTLPLEVKSISERVTVDGEV
jgi:hypothetical protein